jgi:hypothetical protein
VGHLYLPVLIPASLLADLSVRQFVFNEINEIEEEVMDSAEDFGGVLRMEFTVECATCCYWTLLAGISFKQAEKYARRNGWSKTKSYGWICKECSEKDQDSLVVWKPDIENILNASNRNKKIA